MLLTERSLLPLIVYRFLRDLFQGKVEIFKQREHVVLLQLLRAQD